MKQIKNRLSIGILFVCTFLFYACSSESDSFTNDERTVLNIAVEANNFYNGSSLTRIDEEDDYSSTFSEGDTLAIFGVYNGQVLADCNNRPFVYDGTNWVDPSGEPLYHHAQTTYYAYFPYEESASITNNITDLVDNFTPKSDQSTRWAYIHSDLLTSTGSVTQNQLVFQFDHVMSLLDLSFPTIQYQYSGNKRKPYLVPLGSNFVFEGIKPYELEQNRYRYIVKPKSFYYFYGTYEYENKTLHFSYSDYNYSLESGHYKQFNINKDHNIVYEDFGKHQGDYFLKDGRIISSNPDKLTDEDRPNVIGIIFYTESTSRFDSYERKVIREEKGQPDIHGYVMALKDATYEAEYVSATNALTFDVNYYDHPNIPNYTTTEECDQSTAGYYYTQELSKNLSYMQHHYAIDAVTLYNKKHETPRNTTEWFIPSMGQWLDLLRKLSTATSGMSAFKSESYGSDNAVTYVSNCTGKVITQLNNKMKNLESSQYDPFVSDRYYWSSQEYNSYYQWGVSISTTDNSSDMWIWAGGKWNERYVRCILAF